MKKTTTTDVMAAAIACAMLASATAHAQTRPLQAQPPRELDPAKRVPVTPQATRDTDATVPAMQAILRVSRIVMEVRRAEKPVDQG